MMKEKDLQVYSILTKLGLQNEQEEPLSDEEEKLLKYATDPEYRHYEDMKRIFSKGPGEKDGERNSKL